MPRRDQTPPYEIMRQAAQSGEAVSASVPEVEPSPAPPAGRAPWWVGSSAPLVLRLPRGVALLAVIGVLGVVVVAYWVGTIRGAAGAAPEPAETGLTERPGPSGYYQAEQTPYQGPTVEVPEQAKKGDQREPGLNYMRLIQSTPADCQALAEFFGARGVAIQLVTVNNGRSCIAYAVKRGYRADELGSESCKLYEQQLRSLGRQWKIHNGRGTDLSTMYFERYDG